MSQGQMIAGVGGAVLLLSLFLPWFSDFNGWESNTTTDIFLLIVGLVAIGTALTAGDGFSFPGVTMTGATALLGAVALILMVWLVVFDFPEGADRGIGVILALIASAAIAYGGYTEAD